MPVAKHLSSDDEEDERGFWHLEVEVEPEGGAVVHANGCAGGGVKNGTGHPSGETQGVCNGSGQGGLYSTLKLYNSKNAL